MVSVYFMFFISSGHAHSQVPKMLLMRLALLGCCGDSLFPTMPSPSALHLFHIVGQTPRSLVMYFRRVRARKRLLEIGISESYVCVETRVLGYSKEEDMDPRSALQKDNKENTCAISKRRKHGHRSTQPHK